MTEASPVTRLLSALREGDPDALGALVPLVYAELRRIARIQLRAASGATLNTTAVVHEAYLKLGGAQGLDFADRGHFFAVAATAMRQVLLDHARRHLADKRGGGAAHTLLDDLEIPVEDRAAELVELDQALTRLEELDERTARVVELRFYAGLSVEETAQALDVSAPTVKRDWRRARAFLYRELGEAV
jgi:RNA polymerase sigma factor (TIGR02999 family)